MLKYYKYKFLKALGLVSKNKYAKKTAKYTSPYKAIARSKYFDKSWYLKQTPDVKKAGVDPVQHYLTKGWKEGRNPSAKFDGDVYLNVNIDVKRTKMNPLLHYEKHGKKEGRINHLSPTSFSKMKSKLKKRIKSFPSTIHNLYINLKLKFIKDKPFFSMIMPTYNRAYCIKESIDSVLAQTYQNFELIIVDDYSTDDTKSYIESHYAKELAEKKIVYVNSTKDKGVCNARNQGLALSKYEWIAYVDSDNKIYKNYLTTFANSILKNKLCRVFYCALEMRNAQIVLFRKFDLQKLLNGNYIDLGVFVHSRSLYEKLGGFDLNLKRLVDWDLIIRYASESTPFASKNIVLEYNDDENEDRISMSENFTSAEEYIYNKYKHLRDSLKISTIITTFNHEKYIAQAIESALMQKGSFEHEIIISDDASSDNTPAIIEEYAKKYPNIIKNISVKKNLGISGNMKRCFEAATGKYVAVLEGDDYWTCERKLERQSSFLESKNDCSMVFSRINILDVNTGIIYKHSAQEKLPQKISARYLLRSKNISIITNFSSTMFISEYMKNLPEVLYFDRLSEISLAFYLDKKGRIGVIDDVLGVYRIHSNGVWSGKPNLLKLQSGLICRLTARKVARWKYKYALTKLICRYKKQLKKQLKRSRDGESLKISTVITTYNHEKYIAQAIESALIQKGNFEHEIIISDDASSDNTPAIIEEYAKKYPNIIKNISVKKNLGISGNMKRCFEAATGKYLAILEGDDYWTCDYKLERQSSFLESKKDCSMVFSRINILNEKTQKYSLLKRQDNLPKKIRGRDVIDEPTLNLIANFSSTMFRLDVLKNLPDTLYSPRLNEIVLSFYLTKNKSCMGFISEVLSVYRQHLESTWTGASAEKRRAEGRRIREVALSVCDKKYAPALQKIIDRDYS